MANQTKISVERVKEVLDYNPETGAIVWKKNTAKCDRVGDEAGKKPGYHGHRIISLDKRDYLAQRLAWAIMTGRFPSGRLFFKDGDKLNLKWSNLSVTKSLTHLGFDHKTSDGRKQYAKAYHKENPGKIRNSQLLRDFGIDLKEYQRMFVAQGGVCAICKCEENTTRNGKPLWLSVDHDHETDGVRSLLCKKCNIGLGAFQDNETHLESALAYLRHHRSQPVEQTNVVRMKHKELR